MVHIRLVVVLKSPLRTEVFYHNVTRLFCCYSHDAILVEHLSVDPVNVNLPKSEPSSFHNATPVLSNDSLANSTA